MNITKTGCKGNDKKYWELSNKEKDKKEAVEETYQNTSEGNKH